MSCKHIDLSTYPRRQHFEHFLHMAYPYVGVTQMVDVTAVRAFCHERHASFYTTFLHAVALAADGVPELRRRIRSGGIVEYDACSTSHTELLQDGTYCYCTLRHGLPMAEYLPYAEEARRRARENASLEEDDDVESMYFISALPWLHYTELIQPVAGGEDSNPRISWGRFAPDHAGRLMMPVSILAHHALADGLHLARFYENLTEQLRRITCGG